MTVRQRLSRSLLEDDCYIQKLPADGHATVRQKREPASFGLLVPILKMSSIVLKTDVAWSRVSERRTDESASNGVFRGLGLPHMVGHLDRRTEVGEVEKMTEVTMYGDVGTLVVAERIWVAILGEEALYRIRLVFLDHSVLP